MDSEKKSNLALGISLVTFVGGCVAVLIISIYCSGFKNQLPNGILRMAEGQIQAWNLSGHSTPKYQEWECVDDRIPLPKGVLRLSDGQIKQYNKTPEGVLVLCGEYDWDCANSEIREILGRGRIGKLQSQLNCLESGGHKLEFAQKRSGVLYFSTNDKDENGDLVIGASSDIYVFKCSKCSKEIEKTESELTESEINALKELGIIKE